ncbi:uncharacterized protein PSFLO_04213 [Pseudozyma flocculosa]|uniref:Uncharacterized protein n=1 Tax=Pseudozyma flocculosa TaxID=84751 RepID=A0A5C3F2L9_9BASI|nr:uncharacterized protein PSFLO_04213 [Pseudozyma flocculosa]
MTKRPLVKPSNAESIRTFDRCAHCFNHCFNHSSIILILNDAWQVRVETPGAQAQSRRGEDCRWSNRAMKTAVFTGTAPGRIASWGDASVRQRVGKMSSWGSVSMCVTSAKRTFRSAIRHRGRSRPDMDTHSDPDHRYARTLPCPGSLPTHARPQDGVHFAISLSKLAKEIEAARSIGCGTATAPGGLQRLAASRDLVSRDLTGRSSLLLPAVIFGPKPAPEAAVVGEHEASPPSFFPYMCFITHPHGKRVDSGRSGPRLARLGANSSNPSRAGDPASAGTGQPSRPVEHRGQPPAVSQQTREA